MGKVENRQTRIVELITELEKVDVVELSNRLGVSQVTIRKDLDALETKGLIVREHGFATINSKDDMNTRLAFHYEAKQKIAREACTLIQNGEIVMIESGSCCALLAQEIVKQKKDVTIITNSAFIANYIHQDKKAKVILLGGEYQNESQVNVGPMIKKCVEAFHVDKFFIGTDGYNEQIGFTGNDYMRCEAVRDMKQQTSHVFIVTESDKFNRTGPVFLLKAEEVDYVITDDHITSDMESHLQEKGIIIKKAV